MNVWLSEYDLCDEGHIDSREIGALRTLTFGPAGAKSGPARRRG
jgi:hypothetical protein